MQSVKFKAASTSHAKALGHAPASTSHAKALGHAERRDVSEMLQDIDSIELSLGVQHVRLRAVACLPCGSLHHCAFRLSGCGMSVSGREACAFEILKLAFATRCRSSALVFSFTALSILLLLLPKHRPTHLHRPQLKSTSAVLRSCAMRFISWQQQLAQQLSLDFTKG